MLNTQSLISPNTLKTRDDVDNAARKLTAVWEQSFAPAPSLDGKKKNKLRDMVCRLAGFDNGYQQFLAHLQAMTIPDPENNYELPEKIMIHTCPGDIEFLFMISEVPVNNRDPESIHPDSEECLYVVMAEEGMEGDKEPLMKQGESLRDCDLWRYICKHYEVDSLSVIMANTSKYGINEEATEEGGRAFVEDLYLDCYEGFLTNPEDRGDDGGSTAIIYLSRKKMD